MRLRELALTEKSMEWYRCYQIAYLWFEHIIVNAGFSHSLVDFFSDEIKRKKTMLMATLERKMDYKEKIEYLKREGLYSSFISNEKPGCFKSTALWRLLNDIWCVSGLCGDGIPKTGDVIEDKSVYLIAAAVFESVTFSEAERLLFEFWVDYILHKKDIGFDWREDLKSYMQD